MLKLTVEVGFCDLLVTKISETSCLMHYESADPESVFICRFLLQYIKYTWWGINRIDSTSLNLSWGN